MFPRLGKTLCDKTTHRTDSKNKHYEVVTRCYPGSVLKSVPITIFHARVMISKMKTTNAIFSKLGKSPCDKTHRTESKINLCNTIRPVPGIIRAVIHNSILKSVHITLTDHNILCTSHDIKNQNYKCNFLKARQNYVRQNKSQN